MKLLTVDTIENARAKLLDCRKELARERVPIADALGRILAADVRAREDVPNFRRSTVDGYAAISADTAGAGESLPVLLRPVGTVEMGRPAGFAVGSGECAYVPTGGMIPDGADAVVMVEYSENLGGEIALYESAAVGGNVVRVGEDLAKGEVLLRSGTALRSQEIGALAAAGITEVEVFLPLSLTIISSGDELIPPEATPEPCQVRDINAPALQALARESHFRVVSVLTVKDDEKALEAAVSGAMGNSDVVAVSGGSSQGTKDMTAKVLDRLADSGVFVHGLAIKPGKPTILAHDKKSDTILVGLPGHPVSALTVFRVLFSWLSRRLSGLKEPVPVPATIACNTPGSPGRACYQPVSLSYREGRYLAEPVFGKSGLITTLTKADGYIVIGLNDEGIEKGETVEVFPFGE
ncbi:MAG: molybdopterin molybdotransferase MoeA [Treponema sp.]|nr:molybdopterin molybdotransferase MoeA [Treponema sp.]